MGLAGFTGEANPEDLPVAGRKGVTPAGEPVLGEAPRPGRSLPASPAAAPVMIGLGVPERCIALVTADRAGLDAALLLPASASAPDAMDVLLLAKPRTFRASCRVTPKSKDWLRSSNPIPSMAFLPPSPTTRRTKKREESIVCSTADALVYGAAANNAPVDGSSNSISVFTFSVVSFPSADAGEDLPKGPCRGDAVVGTGIAVSITLNRATKISLPLPSASP